MLGRTARTSSGSEVDDGAGEVITPDGFEGYIARLGELLAKAGPPDLGEIAARAGAHGMEVDPAAIPVLAAEHDLRLP
jgi:hypothetical protein